MNSLAQDPSLGLDLPFIWNTGTDWPGNENFYGLSNGNFDSTITSLPQLCAEALELSSSSFEPSCSSSGFSSPLYGLENTTGDMVQEVGLELEVETDNGQQPSNMQKQNYDYRSIQQIMSSQKPSNSYTAMERDLNDLISGYLPEVPGDLNSMQVDKKTWNSDLDLPDLETSFTDLDELTMPPSPSLPFGFLHDVLPWDDTLPIQDSTVSGSHEHNDIPILGEESVPSLLNSNTMTMDGGDNLLNFMDPRNDDVPPDVPMALPILTPKRRRGRPRKDQSKPVVEPDYYQLTPCMSYTVLPERNCKRASMQKIQNLLSEVSDLGASDQEDSLREGSRKRARKVTRKYEKDPDYNEVDHITNTLLLTDISSPEDEERKRRKKNNEASKKSREKRKLDEEKKEWEREKLEKRSEYLKAIAKRLEKAVFSLMMQKTAENLTEGSKEEFQ